MPESNQSPKEILDGVLTRILFRSDDGRFGAGILKDSSSSATTRVAGEIGMLQEGDTVRLVGLMKDDERFGRQFKVAASYPILPHTEAGLVGYLSSGRIQSVGPKLAERLVAYFGTETLQIISEAPERLTEVEGIGPKRSEEISSQVREHVLQRDALVFLQGLNLSASAANKVWQHYGENAITVVRDNPYRLAAEIAGIGFQTSDQLAQQLGFEADSEVRVAAAIIHILTKGFDDGHVYLPEDLLIERTMALIGADTPVGQQLSHLKSAGHLLDDGGIYLPFVHLVETELARRFTACARQIPETSANMLAAIESRLGFQLADKQRDAVELATSTNLMILTGGPGTGKTTTVQAIKRALDAMGEEVVMAAPTGRAARRLADATQASASTIHRLLGYHPVDGFRYGEDEPLPADAIIIDEASMLDQQLALALLRALQPGARLILVGDAHQLPSVGPGNVLADLLSSRTLPTVQLTEVFRQAEASDIVSNAYRILSGVLPESAQMANGGDFFVVTAETPTIAADLIEQMVHVRMPRRFGLDPVEDIQVLAPMHRGVCGAHQLNTRLQDRLNPDGATIKRGGRKFRVGDKVMQVKNDYQKEVFNGDLGRIMAQTESGITIRFDNRVLEYEGDALDNLTLAYACSVHKSQGSEYPAVIIPMLTEHWLMLQRNLLYTAVTRGKSLVVVVGQRRAIERAVRNVEGVQRYTQLAHRLNVQ
ncbi:MAG: ATP-dependent RecD-like DNA helicase [Myxococcota bacterium]|nr:ATP-dependent RecD-like DNA helicase [Myxococcota bacterium]